jgi:acyl-CoA hydrolase
MPEPVTAQDAAALMQPEDTLGIPLGTGQPPAFLAALGERDDWTNLRIYGALLLAWSEAFKHPNVHYLSGFFGPIERALRDQGANLGFAPADFRRFEPLLEAQAPRVMATVAAPPDADGWCSLSLHVGGTLKELGRAAADPDRLLIVEVSPRFPRTHGLPPEHPHALHVDQIDIVVESDATPFELPDPKPSEVDEAIAAHARRFVPDGATLQTGIGAIPSAIVGRLADGDGGDYGVHSEMFTNGLMRLHRAGKVTNARKGLFDGVSVATFAGGSRELYDWLDGNEEVAFLPVDVVNSPDVIGRNRDMVTFNAAISIDVHGQVVADTIDGRQYSGIGGHEDFVAGALSLSDRALLCLPSTVTIGDELRSRIVPWFGPGAVITTPRHQVDVIVTEHGAAELQGLTVHQRGMALAEIAHPDFRDGLREAAERASHGNSAVG